MQKMKSFSRDFKVTPMPRFLDPFSQTWEIWVQGSGAAGYVASTTYFSNLFEKKGGFQTNATLSLILRFNLRLGGYSIWSAIFQSDTISRIKFGA
jgi:hypothetical protein